jgi:tetratricopeptide (TPR) repeat protein
LLAITKAVAPMEETAPSVPPPSERPAAPSSLSSPPGRSASIPAAAPDAAIAADDGALHGRLDRLQNIPSPPDELSDELRQRWLRVVTKGRLIENQNYFEMLDIDREAKSSDARAKFYTLAKEWHPDRLPPELMPLREYVQIIFSYMSEANTTLGDENQRVKYVQSVREGGGTPAAERLMQTILDTAMEYERVLVMSRKREWDDALELMKKILVVVKEEADYHAMYAWLLMQRFPGEQAPLQKMLESANRALELNDRHERANLLKAQILRRMGRPSEALEYFRTVVDINPRNVDAMREVRVASMRNEKLESKAPPRGNIKGKGKGKGKGRGKEDEGGVGGLLGKLFKK